MADARIEIDGARIQAMLDELHALGRRPSGTTFRGLYSPAWRQARDRIASWMAEAGLEVSVDAVGNVWGHLVGREPGDPIVAGSHFDTVPAGPAAPRIVGAVPAITGTGRLQVTLKGQPDHTGTTPMLGRRDALLGAAEVALALREMALGVGHPAKLTVARLEVIPNIPNVIAGEVRFSVDARHPEAKVERQLM